MRAIRRGRSRPSPCAPAHRLLGRHHGPIPCRRNGPGRTWPLRGIPRAQVRRGPHDPLPPGPAGPWDPSRVSGPCGPGPQGPGPHGPGPCGPCGLWTPWALRTSWSWTSRRAMRGPGRTGCPPDPPSFPDSRRFPLGPAGRTGSGPAGRRARVPWLCPAPVRPSAWGWPAGFPSGPVP